MAVTKLHPAEASMLIATRRVNQDGRCVIVFAIVEHEALESIAERRRGVCLPVLLYERW